MLTICLTIVLSVSGVYCPVSCVVESDTLAIKINKFVEHKITENYFVKDGKPLTKTEIKQISKELSEAVVKWSKKYDLDPILILAITYTESSFRPWLECKNDKGVTQINVKLSAPHTARILKIKLDKEALFNPDYNLRLFGRYFVYLRKHLSLEKSIMAYNIGITRVIKLYGLKKGYPKPNKKDLRLKKVGQEYLAKVKKYYLEFNLKLKGSVK